MTTIFGRPGLDWTVVLERRPDRLVVGEPEAGYAEHDAALWRRYLIWFGAGAGRKIGLDCLPYGLSAGRGEAAMPGAAWKCRAGPDVRVAQRATI